MKSEQWHSREDLLFLEKNVRKREKTQVCLMLRGTKDEFHHGGNFMYGNWGSGKGIWSLEIGLLIIGTSFLWQGWGIYKGPWTHSYDTISE